MTAPTTCPRCGAGLSDPERVQGLCAGCLLVAGLEPEAPAEGAPAARRPAPAIADLAPHFEDLEIVELVGQGGMGAVYRVRQTKLGREAALKVLALDASASPAFGERFEREARTLAALDHENIVHVYDTGRAGPWWYLLMEFVDGVSLRQMIRAREVDPRTALALVAQLCDALQCAHDHGVVHRDIKPENVLVDRKGRVKILDFGLAKLLGREPRTGTLTETGLVLGTPRYMAPEQWERPLAVDHRADIYSVGVVFYELLTGELPIGAFALPSQKGAPDARVDPVVMKTLAKEPERRYQHASEVRTAVQRIQGTPAPAGAKPGPDEVFVRRDHLKRVAWITLGMAGCLTILLVPILAFVFLGARLDSAQDAALQAESAALAQARAAALELRDDVDGGPSIDRAAAAARGWSEPEYRERFALVDALWRAYLASERQTTEVEVLADGHARIVVGDLGTARDTLDAFALLAAGPGAIRPDPAHLRRYAVDTAVGSIRRDAPLPSGPVGADVGFRAGAPDLGRVLGLEGEALQRELDARRARVQAAVELAPELGEVRPALEGGVQVDVFLDDEPHGVLLRDGRSVRLSSDDLRGWKHRRFLEAARTALGR